MAGHPISIAALYVGGPRPLGPPELDLRSGIAKELVDPAATLALTTINLAGDDQEDRTVHGGVDKAVYAYASEHRTTWADDLDDPTLRDPAPTVAPFGENVATVGVDETGVRIGDVWTWGTARLQVCQPRSPCQKLTIHRRHARVGPLLRTTGRTGWYLRVLAPGEVPASGPIAVDPHPAGISVTDANRAMGDRHLGDRDLARRVVDLGPVLADEWRLPLVERLTLA